jgi:two-component system, OmpR family, KDP operon response regulator KdpE
MGDEVLVIDDEKQMRTLLEITLQSNGYAVRNAKDAREGLIAAANHPPGLIILDLGLPDESGHVVLRRLREWYTRPVIILSVQNSEEDIVQALDNGATDYLIKPFRTAELLARIRSALRVGSSQSANAVIDRGDIHINLSNHVVKRKGEVVKLTATEYNLLALLVTNEGKVLTHQFLLQQVWGPSYRGESQYLRVYIAQLRKKLKADPNRPVHILTEPRVGYRFVLE